MEAFRNALIGQSCSVTRREYDWCFELGDVQGFATPTPWRLVGPDGILLTDTDHGQLFGITEPVDATVWVDKILGGALVERVEIDPITADLALWFSNGVRLEVWNSSCAHEGWHGWRPGGEIVALGGGGISLFETAAQVAPPVP